MDLGKTRDIIVWVIDVGRRRESATNRQGCRLGRISTLNQHSYMIGKTGPRPTVVSDVRSIDIVEDLVIR